MENIHNQPSYCQHIHTESHAPDLLSQATHAPHFYAAPLPFPYMPPYYMPCYHPQHFSLLQCMVILATTTCHPLYMKPTCCKSLLLTSDAGFIPRDHFATLKNIVDMLSDVYRQIPQGQVSAHELRNEHAAEQEAYNYTD
ncbi:hypothetical protein NL676_008646 [Syzygium grande]|nr:hypothetical protein NL676_008646 [Syzygium grande]